MGKPDIKITDGLDGGILRLHAFEPRPLGTEGFLKIFPGAVVDYLAGAGESGIGARAIVAELPRDEMVRVLIDEIYYQGAYSELRVGEITSAGPKELFIEGASRFFQRANNSHEETPKRPR